MGQATVPASSTVAVFTVPPSSCAVTFYNLSAATVYLGTSTAVTTSSGLQCHSIPTSFTTFVGGRGTVFYGTTGSSTAASVNYLIVTDF